VLAVLVERRRADAAELAARERRLQQVRGVGRAFGGAGADDRVQLVDEEDHLALRLGDLAQHGLETILELAAVLGARDQRAEVERDDAPVLQRVGHVARDDALGEALDDGRLADARLADQDRVVLGAAREHLHDAADLVVAADDRIELAAARDLGEIAPIFRERLVLRLGILIRHARAAAHRLERLQQRVLGDAFLAQRTAGGIAFVRGDAEQEVLGRDVLVLQLLRFLEGSVERTAQRVADARLRRRTRYTRQRRQQLVELCAERLDRDAELQEHRHGGAFRLRDQRTQEVRRLDHAVATARREGLGLGQGLLALDGELVELHPGFLSTAVGRTRARGALIRARPWVSERGSPTTSRREHALRPCASSPRAPWSLGRSTGSIATTWPSPASSSRAISRSRPGSTAVRRLRRGRVRRGAIPGC
jgi:hypothetical protein